MSKKPVIQLTQYQQASARVRARFRLKKWCRQSGKTFEETREIADDTHARKTRWVILSRGERQSKNNIEQCAMHCRAYGLAAQPLEDTWQGEEGTYKSLTIKLPNGSDIIGLPANPDTARGFSANVYLDEFAFHLDSRKIWTSLFGVITRGYQLRITSTPQGKLNKFYELDTLWSRKAEEGDPAYHVSNLNIYDAVKGGLDLRDEEGRPTSPEQLKEALADEEAWDQEYMVLYVDEATAFLSYDLIASCEDDRIVSEPAWVALLLAKAAELHAVYLQSKQNPPSYEVLDHALINANALYLGMDIARKRHLSVIWLNEERDGQQKTVAVIALKKMPFFIQKVVLFSLLSHPMMVRACLDQTGIGEQLAEESIDRFGASKVEGIMFTAGNKELLAEGCKRKMEDKIPQIPAELAIRNSLHSVKRFGTATGHFRFDAIETEQTGHADYFWGQALALHAAGAPNTVALWEQII